MAMQRVMARLSLTDFLVPMSMTGTLRLFIPLTTIIWISLLCLVHDVLGAKQNVTIGLECKSLKSGQYFCDQPVIDPKTQQAAGCAKDSKGNYSVQVSCYPVEGITCNGIKHTGQTEGFKKIVPCKWTNNYSFKTSLLLSIFLGMFGIDRFYLGYPALGLLKFCTLGFMFLGQLVDILLIATQVVGPADGSHYVVDYYGAGLAAIQRDNQTYHASHLTG